jgi:uncharacterized protein (DUF2249 family)
MKFSLSSQGLKNLNIHLSDNDFTIKFNNKSIEFPTLLAEFLSPIVSTKRKQDSTIHSILINHDIQDENIINDLEKLVCGKEINLIKESEIVSILLLLGNAEIFEREYYPDIQIDNVYSLLKSKKKVKANYENEIKFISEHFEEMKNENFSIDLLNLILSSEHLKIQSENSLFSFIEQKIKTNIEYSNLLQYLHIEYFTQNEIEQYVLFIDSLYSYDIKGLLWSSIRLKLLNPSPTFNLNRYLFSRFEFKDNKRFEGIFHYLSTQCSGNIHDQGLVKAESKSIYSDHYPKNLLQESGYFYSNNQPNEWISFNFLNKKVSLNGYSLKSYNNSYYLQNWNIEGSNDNKEWNFIDNKTNIHNLDGSEKEDTFLINESKPYQIIRLTQTTKSNNNNDLLLLNRIEFYGALYSP